MALHSYIGHSVCMCSHGICSAYHAYECLQMMLNFSKANIPASTISIKPTSRIEKLKPPDTSESPGICSKTAALQTPPYIHEDDESTVETPELAAVPKSPQQGGSKAQGWDKAEELLSYAFAH